MKLTFHPNGTSPKTLNKFNIIWHRMLTSGQSKEIHNSRQRQAAGTDTHQTDRQYYLKKLLKGSISIRFSHSPLLRLRKKKPYLVATTELLICVINLGCTKSLDKLIFNFWLGSVKNCLTSYLFNVTIKFNSHNTDLPNVTDWTWFAIE